MELKTILSGLEGLKVKGNLDINVQSEFLATILNPKWSSCKTVMFYGIKHSALHQDPKVLMKVAKMLYD